MLNDCPGAGKTLGSYARKVLSTDRPTLPQSVILAGQPWEPHLVFPTAPFSTWDRATVRATLECRDDEAATVVTGMVASVAREHGAWSGGVERVTELSYAWGLAVNQCGG